MCVIGIIPARYNSTRFPGKPLALIKGKTMIQRVYEQAKMVSELKKIIVATDDERIAKVVKSFGGDAVLTGNFNCGSERAAFVVSNIDCDVVVNIQGDEPIIPPELIRQIIKMFDDSTIKMATLKKELIDNKDIVNPNIVKVVTDKNNNAIFFSRSAIPFCRNENVNVRYYKHIGIYGYTKKFLLTLPSFEHSKLEAAEELEQLRVLENGYKIRVAETMLESMGVDLPEHIAVIEALISRNGGDDE